MSNTNKVNVRFWDAMRARFGMKWINEQGLEPTAPWVKLLDDHTPEDLKRALEIQSADKREWPPTLDEFAAYLKKASTQRSAASARNYLRDYWRSVILHWVATALQLNSATLQPLVLLRKDTLGESMRTLLDHMCDLELKTGQRTDGMAMHCTTRCYEIARAFEGDEPELVYDARHPPARAA